MDVTTKRYFVACDYNRDGNSFRSPWSNKYFPPLGKYDGFKPPEHLRSLEIECNKMFETYIASYYGDGVGSVYVWESVHEDAGVAAAFVIHKVSDKKAGFSVAQWDSINICEMKSQKSSVSYRVTSTVILSLVIENDLVGSVDLGTTITRQHEQHRRFSEREAPRHVMAMGMMIEDLENSIRKDLQRVYLGKLSEILNNIRLVSPQPVDEESKVGLSRQFTGMFEGHRSLSKQHSIFDVVGKDAARDSVDMSVVDS